MEYEIIHYPRLRHISIFLINIRYRNSHIHNALEAFTVLDGRGTIRLKHGSVAVERGSVVLFNSDEAHEIDAGQEGITAIVTQVSRHFCGEYVHELRNIEFRDNDVLNYLDGKRGQEMVRSICVNALEYVKAERCFELGTLANMCRILETLILTVPNLTIDDSTYLSRAKRIKRMNDITAYIDSHYLERITLDDIAERENITPTHLSHFFSENFGVGFQEYINNLRFEKAMRLIGTPKTTLLTAALESGFSDPKYMTRLFLKRLGCTPKEYRRRYVKEIPDAERGEGMLQYYYTDEESIRIIQSFLESMPTA